jgi:hypothetical protein
MRIFVTYSKYAKVSNQYLIIIDPLTNKVVNVILIDMINITI